MKVLNTLFQISFNSSLHDLQLLLYYFFPLFSISSLPLSYIKFVADISGEDIGFLKVMQHLTQWVLLVHFGLLPLPTQTWHVYVKSEHVPSFKFKFLQKHHYQAIISILNLFRLT